LAAGAGETITPEYQRFFNAATNGDTKTIVAMFDSFKHRHRQYDTGTNKPDPSLDTVYWQPVLEISLAYQEEDQSDPKYISLFSNGIIRSIPPGSIYFGGTDPGRGLPTAFSKNQIAGDPFFTLTQNALADGTYLKYTRTMYGSFINLPSEDDVQFSFSQYVYGAQQRLKQSKLRPGEEVKIVNGHAEVSGVAAVMGLDALLVQTIIDKNPGREFYMEESYPLDGLYPCSKPHGLILQIEHQPIAALSEETISSDHANWVKWVNQMIGPWLEDGTPLPIVTGFARKVFVEHDLAGFAGDPRFVANDYACKSFSKLRATIAGLYAWRLGALKDVPTPTEYLPGNDAERDRLAVEADVAFRQAFAMCPYNSETASRYAYFLVMQERPADALMLAESAKRVQSSLGQGDGKLNDLIAKLREKTLFDPGVNPSLRTLDEPAFEKRR
ncbi:MAG TPA: hypothetical protein VGN61_15980, partial [Verrucomicrobiae bacterium]